MPGKQAWRHVTAWTMAVFFAGAILWIMVDLVQLVIH